MEHLDYIGYFLGDSIQTLKLRWFLIKTCI